MAKDVKYIKDSPQYGIEYEWGLIKKDFKALKTPKDCYNPAKLPLAGSTYFNLLSERSTGKTTNVLLLGMVQNWRYGTTMCYIRDSEKMIAPSNLGDLFGTILDYGYVSKVTGERWNSIAYKARRWYYCNIDENGEEIERAPDYFMINLSIDQWDRYKSSLVLPKGDFIIFDEYIGQYYRPNSFINFTQVLSTILRDRESGKIFLLANTINRHSTYFNEFEIYDEVNSMEVGESRLIRTDGGTSVYVELIGVNEEKRKKRSITSKLYYGFKNPLLQSITGGGWAMENAPHIINEDKEVVNNTLFIQHNRRLVKLKLCYSDRLGYHVDATWATKTYEDSTILTLSNIDDPRQIFALGLEYSKLKNLWKLYATNKFYYATNDVKSFIDNYFNEAKRGVKV